MKTTILQIMQIAAGTVFWVIFLTQGGDAAGQSSCVQAPVGLVSWWPAEGNAKDALGSNDGQLLDGTTFGPGEVNQGLMVNGATSGVKIAANQSLDVGAGAGVTVEAWINPQDLSIRGEIMEWNNGTDSAVNWGISLQILSPGELGLGAGNLFADLRGVDGIGHRISAPGGTLTTNIFQHVALTYDKTGGVARLFCNGVVVATQTFGSFTPQTTYDLYIGRRPAGSSAHSFLGGIDEAGVYNRALSADEIAAIYNAGSAGKCQPRQSSCVAAPAGLVSWWPADGNAKDAAGRNDGQLLGGITFGPGEVNQGFLVNGGTSGVKIAANQSLDVGAGDGFTVEAWINPQDLSIRGEIMEWNNGTDNAVNWGISLGILRPGELGLGAGNLFADLRGLDQAAHWISAPGGTLTTNLFQHVALTYDKASGVARLFCNGVVVATNEQFGSFTPQTTYDLYIGRRPAGSSAHSFLGGIDEAGVYNRALSADEIAAIYSAGSAGKCRSLAVEILVTQVNVCWFAETNKTYQLEFRSEATTNLWTPLGPMISGDSSRKCIPQQVGNEARRFFRVSLLP